jgi:hypothetical protein
VSATFQWARRLHRACAAILAALALVHCVLTFRLYSMWSPEAVWFLGAGLGLLLLAVVNWAHVGVEPCDMPTAPVVRWAKFAFATFGVAALVAVPVPQAFVIALALVGQSLAGLRTLRRSTSR